MFGKKKNNNNILHTEPEHKPLNSDNISAELTDEGDDNISLIDVSKKAKAYTPKHKEKSRSIKDYIVNVGEDFEDFDAIEDTFEDRKLSSNDTSIIIEDTNDEIAVDEPELSEDNVSDMAPAVAAAEAVVTNAQNDGAKTKETKAQKKARLAKEREEKKAQKEARQEVKKADKGNNKESGTIGAKVKSLKEKYLGDLSWEDILAKANPEPEKDVYPLADYLVRILIFLFPLYVYETGGIMGISSKDLLFGIVIILMALLCGMRAVNQNFFKKVLDNKSGIAVIASFILVSIVFVAQVLGLDSEIPHTYLYLGCFLIAFCTMFIGKCTKYYLKLFTVAITILYISFFNYIFTAGATLLGSENLLYEPTKLVPLLMLGCAVTSILYITEENANMEKLYLVITAIGEVLLFLYGNMVSFMIFMLFTMGLHFIKEPTKHFMKKNLILLFLFGFCASNAPLLTYFKLRGYSKSFDLEYSIYIDIVIAVLGLIVTGYWEKFSKDEDENTTLMPVLAKWYKRAIELVLVLLAICFVFGSRGAKLKNTFGGKAVAGLATSLWKSISRSNGELWHVMEKYGVIGVAVMLVLGAIIFRRIMLMWESRELDALKKSYIIMAMMFLIQSFFFPFAASSTPVFMIFVGLAISGKYVFAVEEKEAVAATAARPTSTIWLPGYVRTAMENVNKGADGSEDATGKGRSKAYINLAAYSFAAAMAATLLLLVAVAAYRLVAPNTQFGSDVESLVTDAKSKYDEKMLAASLEASNGEVDAASTASSEEELLVAANDASAVETSVASEEASDAASEATTDSELVPGIEAGVSGGDYRIYDPNAKYAEVDEDVSGKEGSVNLRSKPMVEGDVEVVHRLADGEMVKRIGIGENGWSKVVFEGQTLYAVTEYLITDTELARLEEESELAEEEADEVAEAPQEQAAAEAPAAATVDIASMPKGAGNYTVMYENDNKSIAIWSAGKLMGKMNVTDPDGTVQKLTDYGVFTSGSGKNQKRYLNIGSTNPTLPLTINVDAGFVAAVKNMGYSGIYFNKAVNNW